MTHLPIWALLVFVPLLIAMSERRAGRPRPGLELVVLGLSVGIAVWAVAIMPAQFANAAVIAALLFAMAVTVLAFGTFLEMLPALGRSLVRRARPAAATGDSRGSATPPTSRPRRSSRLPAGTP